MTTPDPYPGRRCADMEDCHLIDPHVQALLDREATALAAEFDGTFSPETVAALLHDSFDQLATTATIHTHLPMLAARFARQRLDATAKNQGATVTDLPEVLFVCVHNAGRSQMAAVLLHHHANGTVLVRSAGSAPADTINPAVIAAMAELDLDITHEFPKPLTTEAVQAADIVITMGCGDTCPVFPGKRYLDWQLPDPAGQGIDAVRPIRDEIDRRVKTLLAELVSTTT